MGKLLLTCLFCFILISCNVSQTNLNIDESDPVSTTSITNDESINEIINKFFNYVGEDYAGDVKNIEVRRIELKENITSYIFKMDSKTLMDGVLYFVKYDKLKDEIICAKHFSGGNTYYLKYKIIDITQGKFISVFTASHQGNGGLGIYSIDDLNKLQYSIGRVLISPFQWLDLYGNKYGFSNRGDLYSNYENYTPTDNYYDFNGDGETDVILTGVMNVYNGKTGEVLRRIFIKNVYLYDVDLDTFEFSEKDSYEVVLE